MKRKKKKNVLCVLERFCWVECFIGVRSSWFFVLIFCLAILLIIESEILKFLLLLKCLFFLSVLSNFFFIKLFILFIYFWLHWVFVAARGVSLVVVSGGYSSLQCAGFSLRWLLLLWSMGSRRAGFGSCSMQAQQLWLMGSRAQAQQLQCVGLSCSVACGIFPDQGSNPCPLHWQADSQPLHHQGRPVLSIFASYFWGTGVRYDIHIQ